MKVAFLPRSVSVQRKTEHQDSTIKSIVGDAKLSDINSEGIEVDVACNGSDIPAVDSAIIEKSEAQRWPSSDEEVCAVCGKYGEYICDETDEDVCSLECKYISINKSKQSNIIIQQEITTPISDVDENTDCDFDSRFHSSFTYEPCKSVKCLNGDKLSFLYDKFEIITNGKDIPRLIVEFSQSGFHADLIRNMDEQGYVVPTNVQMQTIPTVLSRRDALVSAHTGSGKSASFILPILHMLHALVGSLPRDHCWCGSPLAIIMAPTRELCEQLEAQAKLFAVGLSNMRTCLLIGGVPLPNQLHRLASGVQLLIGTPGRINDILENHGGALNMKLVRIVVLDEVDCMLQMGFEDQVQSIMEHTASNSQTLFFSATVPASIEKMAEKLLRNPVFISAGQSGRPNKYVKQIILWVEESSKKKKLFSIIENEKHFSPPTIVFVESKLGADMLVEAMEKNSPALRCASIHSGKRQHERSAILASFREGMIDVVVATNLLGRGIDVLDVHQVILFDLPTCIDEYVHQVGRAGRLEQVGSSITFINNTNKNIFLKLMELCRVMECMLPDEVTYSLHLQQQRERRDREKRLSGKRSAINESTEVNPGNLMDVLNKHHEKKRKK